MTRVSTGSAMSSFCTHSPCPPYLRTPRSYPPRSMPASDPDAVLRSRAPRRGVMWPSQMQLLPVSAHADHASARLPSGLGFIHRVVSSFSQLYSSAVITDRCLDAMLCSCARCSSLAFMLVLHICRAYRVVLGMSSVLPICCDDQPTRDDHASCMPDQFLSSAVMHLFAFAMSSIFHPLAPIQ